MLRLPSVTGFILAGLLLGESGLGIITIDLLGRILGFLANVVIENCKNPVFVVYPGKSKKITKSVLTSKQHEL